MTASYIIHETGPTWSTATNVTTIRNKSGCALTSTTNSEVKVGGLYTTSRGGTLDRFHERLRKGELLPFTYWYQMFYNMSAVTAGYSETYKPTNCTVISDTVGLGLTPLIPQEFSVPSQMQIDANPDYYVQRAAANIYGTGWDIATAFAESRQTCDMFLNLGQKLRNWRKYASRFTPRDAAKAWMEVRYGWRIVKYDVEDLYDALTNFDEKRTRYKRRDGASFGLKTYQLTPVITYSGLGCKLTRNETWTGELSLRGSVVADFRPSRITANPFRTGWEVIPYSFVVDWFLGVGNAIAAASLLVLADGVVASKGWKYDIRRVQTLTGSPGTNANYTYSFSGTSLTEVVGFVQRIPTTVSIVPQFEVTLRPDNFLDILQMMRLFK